MADAGGAGSPRTWRKAMLAALPASPQPPNPARSTGRRRPAGGSPSTSCIDRVKPLGLKGGPLSRNDHAQRRQRDRGVAQNGVMERAQIETIRQALLLRSAQSFDLALANLV